MSKRRRGYLTVDVDLGEALDEMTDEMLLQEVADRKLNLGRDFDPLEDLREIHAELLRGRPAEAMAILDRLINPKWPSMRAAEIELARARATVPKAEAGAS